jgi:nuclear pore complex protein Nup98-Nup96
VQEEESSSNQSKAVVLASDGDKEVGEYWMVPSLNEIAAMNREQRSKVSGFTVGRTGVGKVTFNAPVDLNKVDVDNIYDKIVVMKTRSCTVYPDSVTKPARGSGLNVPSTITLENSFPRSAGKGEVPEKILQKHIKRLQRIPQTTFVDYNVASGEWTFKVPHFTTYGLDYDEDEDEDMDVTENDFGQSTLSAPPDSPTPGAQRTPGSATPVNGLYYDQSAISNGTTPQGSSEPEDDTFNFKKSGRTLKYFPGAFDETSAVEVDDDMDDDAHSDSQSFLGERSTGSVSDADEPAEQVDDDTEYQGNELVRVESNGMAGSFPQLDGTVELQHDGYATESDEESIMARTPGNKMRAQLRELRGSPIYRSPLNVVDDNWADMLQRTVSPKKQDREVLKRIRDTETEAGAQGLGQLQQSRMLSPAKNRLAADPKGFATSIDLMRSLFGETKSPVKAQQQPIATQNSGFEVGLSA